MSQPVPEATGTSPRSNDARLVATIVALLAVQASTQALTPKIATLLKPFGISAEAARMATRIAMSAPVNPPRNRVKGSATLQSSLTEPTYRAAYILQSARRIQSGLHDGENLGDLVNKERTWFSKHREAQDNRHVSASRVETAVDRFGQVLGWYAKRDSRTSAECLAAHGQNFRADERPLIGYPGTVHPHCRCLPGPPHVRGKMLASRKVA